MLYAKIWSTGSHKSLQQWYCWKEDFPFVIRLYLTFIMAPHVATSIRLECLPIMSFIILNETSIWGPVKTNSAALDTFERLGYLHVLNTLFSQQSKRVISSKLSNSLSNWRTEILVVQCLSLRDNIKLKYGKGFIRQECVFECHRAIESGAYKLKNHYRQHTFCNKNTSFSISRFKTSYELVDYFTTTLSFTYYWLNYLQKIIWYYECFLIYWFFKLFWRQIFHNFPVHETC